MLAIAQYWMCVKNRCVCLHSTNFLLFWGFPRADGSLIFPSVFHYRQNAGPVYRCTIFSLLLTGVYSLFVLFEVLTLSALYAMGMLCFEVLCLTQRTQCNILDRIGRAWRYDEGFTTRQLVVRFTLFREIIPACMLLVSGELEVASLAAACSIVFLFYTSHKVIISRMCIVAIIWYRSIFMYPCCCWEDECSTTILGQY